MDLIVLYAPNRCLVNLAHLLMPTPINRTGWSGKSLFCNNDPAVVKITRSSLVAFARVFCRVNVTNPV